MSFVSIPRYQDPYDKNPPLARESILFHQLFHLNNFLRGVRLQLRYGELSRAPLRLLRFQMVDKIVECDWMARSPDPWDVDLSRHVQQRHATLQTLRDAIDIRALLFEVLPEVKTAHLHVFRESGEYTPEMIVSGCVQRNDHSSRNLHSMVMRAQILGFHFRLEDEVLRRM
jgi:hypothetical protein